MIYIDGGENMFEKQVRDTLQQEVIYVSYQ